MAKKARRRQQIKTHIEHYLRLPLDRTAGFSVLADARAISARVDFVPCVDSLVIRVIINTLKLVFQSAGVDSKGSLEGRGVDFPTHNFACILGAGHISYSVAVATLCAVGEACRGSEVHAE